MPHWLEIGLVAAVVGAAVFWAVRAAVRQVKKGQVCSTCGDAGNCPLAGKEPTLEELNKLGGDCHHHS